MSHRRRRTLLRAPRPPDDRGGTPLILASASPRRLALLREAGYRVEVRASDVDENELDIPGQATAEQAALIAARAKARAVATRMSQGLVLAADTVVDLGGELLGKPADRGEAAEMLSRLSGTTHRVVTGVVLVAAASGREAETAVATAITMRTLSAAQIQAYVDSGEADDKAGAYAIQESGDRFIERVEGSFSNVVGLPLEVIDGLIASV